MRQGRKPSGPPRLSAGRTDFARAFRRRRDPSQARDDGCGGVVCAVLVHCESDAFENTAHWPCFAALRAKPPRSWRISMEGNARRPPRSWTRDRSMDRKAKRLRSSLSRASFNSPAFRPPPNSLPSWTYGFYTALLEAPAIKTCRKRRYIASPPGQEGPGAVDRTGIGLDQLARVSSAAAAFAGSIRRAC